MTEWLEQRILLDSTTLNPTKDNTLVEDPEGDLSNGVGNSLFVGTTNQFNNSIRRGLIAFDVSGIPVGSSIDSVSLTLRVSKSTRAGAETIDVHRVTSDWGEGDSNSNVNGGGGGIQAQSDDATWRNTFFPSDLWDNVGGDFVATASASKQVLGVGSYIWESTQRLVADVQRWVDRPNTNFGWLLKGNESSSPTAKRFDSREAVVAANRPEVMIEFTPPTVFQFDLEGLQENPPNSSEATGDCTAVLNGAETSLQVDCTHEVTDPSAAHIHRGAIGVNGPVVIGFASGDSPLSLTWDQDSNPPLTNIDVNRLLAGNLYVNVHSTDFSGGELRGQITNDTVPLPSLREFPLQGLQEVPPNSSSATGDCTAVLNASETSLQVDCTHDVANPSGAHIHRGDVGEDGPIRIGFPSAASPISVTWNQSSTPPLSNADVNRFHAGTLYVNVHSSEFPGGELRGQISNDPVPLPTLFEFPLQGLQEVSPNSSDATGSCVGVLNAAETSFQIDCTHTVANPTAAHIHRGSIGVNGPIAIGFSAGDSPLSLTWDDSSTPPLTPNDVADLLAGDLYVNVHSSEFSGGELRGQVSNDPVPLPTLFEFPLEGLQEVPPNSSDATGNCVGVLNAAETSFQIACDHTVTNPTAAHIHRGSVGVNGSIAIGFGSGNSPLSLAWNGSSTPPLTPSDVAELLAGDLYVNVHSGDFSGGELRGQVTNDPVPLPTLFEFPLEGSQEVPPNSSSATGSCVGVLNAAETSFEIDCTHTVTNPTAAHIHRGSVGVNGPIAIGFSSGDSPLSLTWDDNSTPPLTPDDVTRIRAGNLYVNVHSTDFPPGEVRGQIQGDPVSVGFDFQLEGLQEVPPNPSAATGSCVGLLNAAQDSFQINCTHAVADVTAAHIHRGSIGSNGPIAIGFSSGDSPLSLTWDGGSTPPLTPSDVAELLAGDLYVNVHSTAFTGGELRGQISNNPVPLPTLIQFPLEGLQEVPPNPSAATGSCVGVLNAAQDSFQIDCTHAVSDPTAAHIHRGSIGSNGPIAIGFGSGDSPLSLTWDGGSTPPLTPSDVAELLAGDLYVNVHSTAFAGGELRGQVTNTPVPLPTLIEFPLEGLQEVPPNSSAATGSCVGVLNAAQDSFQIDCTHVVSDPTAAHIHRGSIGSNGPIAIGFGLGDSPLSLTWDGGSTPPLTPSDVAELLAGDLYVNVHSAAFTGGELRGQVTNTPVPLPTLIEFPLEGLQEVPPNSSAATGSCVGVLNAAQDSFQIGCTHVVSDPTAAHIHRGSIGSNGPIAIGFGLGDSPLSLTWDGSSTPPLTPSDVAELLAGDLYVNVHSTAFTGGELRGQVTNTPVPLPTLIEFPLEGLQEVPPNSSAATGSCVGVLNAAQDSFQIDCTHVVSDPTAAHIHRGSIGSNGPIAIGFGSGDSPLSLTWDGGSTPPLTPSDVAELLAGDLYVNVHSTAFTGGELRGQVTNTPVPLPTLIEFPLQGIQEVPPNSSDATGSCVGMLNAAQDSFQISCTHTVVNATAAHIHRGPAGTNGPIAIGFGSGDSPLSLTWGGGSTPPLTPSDVVELLAGDLYVNVHSTAFAGGELRGQMGEFTPPGDNNLAIGVEQDQVTIRGDEFNNQIRIQQRGPNTLLVTPLGDSTVNGLSEQQLLDVGDRRLVIITGDGNNKISLGQMSRSVEIEGGRGNDNLLVRSMRSGAGIDITTGNGRDSVRFLNAIFTGDVSISTGSGNDILKFEQIRLLGDAAVRTQGGSDRIFVDDSLITGDVDVNLGSGNDLLSLERRGLQGGERTRIRGALNILLGGGSDRIEAGRANDPGRSVNIRTGLFNGGPNADALDVGVLSDPNAFGNSLSRTLRTVNFEDILS